MSLLAPVPSLALEVAPALVDVPLVLPVELDDALALVPVSVVIVPG